MASKGETDQAIASTIQVHISSVERTQEKKGLEQTLIFYCI
ncbi:hypothetical protein [Nostoc punctiforme]|nr:hypothetical protein [Nostoc punctiforme]